jgi:hypothetical protein
MTCRLCSFAWGTRTAAVHDGLVVTTSVSSPFYWNTKITKRDPHRDVLVCHDPSCNKFGAVGGKSYAILPHGLALLQQAICFGGHQTSTFGSGLVFKAPSWY